MNDDPHRVGQGAAGAEVVDQFQQQQHTAPCPHFNRLKRTPIREARTSCAMPLCT